MENEPGSRLDKFVKSSTGRNFLLETLFFQNGCFLIVNEDELRIGAISIAISSSNKVNVAKVIPSKYDSIFINTIAEKVSSMINGICMVSLYNKNQLQFEDMKVIMEEIMSILGGKKHEEK